MASKISLTVCTLSVFISNVVQNGTPKVLGKPLKIIAGTQDLGEKCSNMRISALSQCIGREIIGAGLPGPFGGPWPYDALSPYDMPHGPTWPSVGCGAGPIGPAAGFAPTAAYGGGLTVTSASPIAPTGLTVTSENTIEGVVAVSGQLPFLGAVATDGIFSTVGAGDVFYGCGDGAIGIVAETPITPAAVAPAYGYGGAPIGGVPYNAFAGAVGCGGYGSLF